MHLGVLSFKSRFSFLIWDVIHLCKVMGVNRSTDFESVCCILGCFSSWNDSFSNSNRRGLSTKVIGKRTTTTKYSIFFVKTGEFLGCAYCYSN